MTIKLAIVEDTPALRKHIEELFTFFKDIRLVASYASGEAAIEGIRRLPPSKIPDVILMDIMLPNISGIETTITIKEMFPQIEIIMITVFEDEQKIFQSIQAGASGYLLKDDAPEKIVDAVRELVKGGAPMSRTVAKKMLDYTRGKMDSPLHDPTEKYSSVNFALSIRERELLNGLVQGGTYATLSKQHCISPLTVKTHIKNIYKKLHVHSRANAVRIALEKNLV
ncbi:MAG: response regulator transcription factor [Bacteriovoracaceae bacterium]|nr:response regulator transcription factor [Bacteroidota bacterium]